MNSENIIILGAGLAGLSLAYYLHKKGINYQIIEARDRIGGRINTLYEDTQAPVEMGATWIDLHQSRMISLLKSLNIGIFEQKMGETAIYEQNSSSPAQIVQLPPNSNPSYRIANGTSNLICALKNKLEKNSIHLNTICKRIDFSGDRTIVHCSTGAFKATKVVNTIPPHLFLQSITLKPELPIGIKEIMETTYTWMGDSIKVSFRFTEKFWEVGHLSGTIFSNIGPITEMYDQSDAESKYYALTGFMSAAYSNANKEERKSLILRQLSKYYGDLVYEYLSYHETLWNKENFTFSNYKKQVFPKQNNGHELYQSGLYNNRFYFAGAEIGRVAHGHMEAVLESVERVLDQISL